jgi:HPt (histidine-containing phosphotransfer) domain-containing protein
VANKVFAGDDSFIYPHFLSVRIMPSSSTINAFHDSEANMQGATPKEVLNYEEALVNVGGSQELLGELAQALKQELPRLMGATRKGLDDGDATAVSRAAHSLKGSITPFAAQRAYDAAWAIEEPSSAGDLSDGDEKFQRLASELEQLVVALDQMLAAG